MISQKSYRSYRYETKKIGWVLGILAYSNNVNYALHWLLTEEGTNFMRQSYSMTEDDFCNVCRNFFIRNMATENSRGDIEPRLFQHEIFEVYRKTVAELRAIHRCTMERISADEVGIDPARWENWLQGNGFLSNEELDAICIASDFLDRDRIICAYRRIIKLTGSYKVYSPLSIKMGSERRLGLI